MPYRVPPDREGYTGSYDHVNRTGAHGPLRAFLEDLAYRDRVVLFEDFLGDTLDLNNWVAAVSGTGTAFTVAAAVNGIIQATTANVDNAAVSLIGAAIWKGDANPLVEVRLKASVATSSNWEVGFVDVAPGSNAGAITDVDVPTVVATNAALITMDTDQTHANFAFVTIGNFTGQTVASTLLTTANSHITAPTADVFFTVKVLLLTDPDETGKTKAYGFINGRWLASHDTVAAGRVNGQQLLAPWIYYRTRAAATPLVTVDYIRVTADRLATE